MLSMISRALRCLLAPSVWPELHSDPNLIEPCGRALQALAGRGRGAAQGGGGLLGGCARGKGFRGGVGFFVTLIDQNTPPPIYDRVVLNKYRVKLRIPARIKP